MNTTQMLTMVHEISKNNQDMASQLLSAWIHPSPGGDLPPFVMVYVAVAERGGGATGL